MKRDAKGKFTGGRGYWKGKKLPKHVVALKKKRMSGRKGAETPRWKGDRPLSYVQYHRRVVMAFGKPSRCDVCGRTDDGITYEWANLTDNYANVNDYKRMCRSCHRRYDFARKICK